jgi:radical SAM superfamily enzyme YgiQ (UPF0313 family)
MNIGLIAMSGIRAYDPELLRLGLTLPGFVERSKTIASLPSLGLLTLAGMTPAGHEVRYIEIPDIKTAGKLPEGLDLIAISSYTAQINEAYQLADQARKAGIPVVMGGPHVSVLPDEALKHCTAVAIGHGELHWKDILSDAAAGKIKPAYGSLEDDYDLADAPMPAFELLDIEKYNRLTIQTSRGCPHQCEFCAGSILFCRRYRQKPVEKVLAELDQVLAVWKHPFIELADDNSFVDKSYWRELLPEMAKRRIRWFTETDISIGEDDNLLELLRKSGCAEVLIGLESPAPEGLDGVETKANWKMQRLPRYRDLLRNIQEHGIRVNGCFVLGLDGQDPGIFNKVREFVKGSDLFDVQITVQTPFPGTPLYDRLRAEGRLVREDDWDRHTLFDVNYRPTGMTIEQLADGFRKLGVDLYSTEWTKERHDRFKKQLRNCQKNERKGRA